MKVVYASLAIAAIFALSWIYKLGWGKPNSFHFFVERTTVEMVLTDPELISYLGIVDGTPFDFFSGKLTDISYTKNVKNLNRIRNMLTVLHRYDREHLSEQDQLTYDILDHYLKTVIDSATFGYGSYDSISNPFSPYLVNQVFGIQSSLPDFMVNIHRVKNKKSGLQYVARLSAWGKKFDDVIDELNLRESHGVILPLFLIEKVLKELEEFIQVAPHENLLFTTLQTKLQKAKLSPKIKNRIEKDTLREIQNTVYPAYHRLIGCLEKQKAKATDDAGVWKFPNGDAYYAKCLRYHTTTPDSPVAVHNLGLSEVARIQAEMRQILDRIGYTGVKIDEAMRTLAKDPRFLYPDTDEGRQLILADFRTIFDQLQDKLPQLFKRLPKAELRVEAVPAFKAETSPLAYYEGPDLKGLRPGVFYANVQNIETHTKYTMPTLAYHEGLPGHHLQVSLAQEISDIPTFRKVVPFTAYIEGWALYSEQLGSEFRFTTVPEHELGKLQYELFRAVRLVVDTGLHHKRWTREEAIQYMSDNTGLSEKEVAIEIDRYIVMPGQACSYKIGMIKFLELREKMKQRLGAGFDIKEFHDIVLGNGAMPLYLLEQYLDRILEGKGKN